MQQHTPHITPRLTNGRELNYLNISTREDCLQASWVRVSSCNDSSLAFTKYKARFVQRGGTGKLHDRDMQVNNKTRNLR